MSWSTGQGGVEYVWVTIKVELIDRDREPVRRLMTIIGLVKYALCASVVYLPRCVLVQVPSEC